MTSIKEVTAIIKVSKCTYARFGGREEMLRRVSGWYRNSESPPGTEGHGVIQKRKKFLVDNYEKSLIEFWRTLGR